MPSPSSKKVSVQKLGSNKVSLAYTLQRGGRTPKALDKSNSPCSGSPDRSVGSTREDPEHPWTLKGPRGVRGPVGPRSLQGTCGPDAFGDLEGPEAFEVNELQGLEPHFEQTSFKGNCVRDVNSFAAHVLDALVRQEAMLQRISKTLGVHRNGSQADVSEETLGREDLRTLVERNHADLCQRLDHLCSVDFDCEGVGEVDEDEHTEKGSPQVQSANRTSGTGMMSLNPCDSGISAYPDRDVRTRIKKFFEGSAYDISIGVVVSLNMIAMLVDNQLAGYEAAQKLGIRENNFNVASARHGVHVLDQVFNVIYLLELSLRVIFLPLSQFREIANVVDAVVVLVCVVNSFIIENLNIASTWYLSVAKLFRMVKIFRLLKIVRLMRNFSDLRILMRVMMITCDSLAWGMVLLMMIMTACAIMLSSLTQGFIDSESSNPDKRLWVYTYFGSSSHAWWTLFEATFTGTWVRFARQTIDDIHEAFAIFWVLYIIIVNFAVMRVIAAMFLRQTMAVAAADAETVAMEALRKKELYAVQLRQVFSIADKDGDGSIDKKEFKAMMKNDEVLGILESMELSVDEATTLFRVLTQENGELEFDEFLEGAMRIKTNARAMDAIVIQHEVLRLIRGQDRIAQDVSRLLRQRRTVTMLSALSSPRAPACENETSHHKA